MLDKVYRNELADYKDDVAEELEELLEQASLSVSEKLANGASLCTLY